MRSIRALILGPAVALGLGLVTASVAAARSAPTCGPRTLNTSALQAGAVTVSPLPGSRVASPHTQISFLGVPARELSGVTVVGSRTGVHSGRLRAYSQGNGASFVPTRPFAEGERVTVRARVRIGGSTRALSDRFGVASEDAISSTPTTIHPGAAADVQRFHSRSDLRPPKVRVTTSSPAMAPGEEFVAPYSGPGQAGPMILDQRGQMVWFKPLPTHTAATNFRVQEYRGKQVLTWWQGNISVHGFGVGEGVIASSAYAEIARVRAGNGHGADLHELQLTPAGTALVTAYDPIRCDLSSFGGSADSAVTNGTLQEIDVRTGLV
ncbi:MAG TPA: arylsulfotransferase family protein, partial [Solirubrobacteraceae bacterium]|nr:arylsulfotransferase family protein [Solirubrobacteraceae bacterium]